MSFFDTVLAASDGVQDALYGEAFLIEPRVKADANGRGAPDPARAVATITGIWTEPHADSAPTNKTGHPSAEGYRFDTSKPVLDFEITALPYALAIGDLVTRTKTGVRYAVADPGDDGFSRASVKLTSVRGRQ